ncbi:MAG: 5-dehydro-4-deoxy-D-glucuronate isomerase [Clostridia bacterium]|nr:5-dehydro-4-deoxy-D-glucuronate isomerase [Clostridia bacterium]
MEIRQSPHSEDAKHYTTERLRSEFLIEGLFAAGCIKRVYSHIDRIIVAGVCPAGSGIPLDEGLDVFRNLGTHHFLERRELGIINIGEDGFVDVDGKEYRLSRSDALYIGMGTKEVIFRSADAGRPAKFYCNSAPAHAAYPNKLIDIDTAKKVHLGEAEKLNVRTINQYLHPAVLETCQLVMGMTILEKGSVWNTMPCHTHERRMEVYLYFDVPDDDVVFHYMGKPDETRHIIVRNEQAVISPSWSLHSGVGTTSYSFIWGMVGENKEFTDMDGVPMEELK